MTPTYQPLPLHRLESGAGYLRPKQKIAGHVTAADPAVWVMTDLSQVRSFPRNSFPIEVECLYLIDHRVRPCHPLSNRPPYRCMPPKSKT